MKSLNKILLKFTLLFIVSLSANIAASAQNARLNFERLDNLSGKATDVVDVSIDGKLLDLAKRVMVKANDAEAKKVAQAISGLKGIYVRVFHFANENEYNVADVDEIRAQLQTPGWERLANVRSKKNNQKIDVFTMFTGEQMSGVAVVISDSKSIALVNVVGPIDIDMLVEMSGRLNIPKIDIEKQDKPKN